MLLDLVRWAFSGEPHEIPPTAFSSSFVDYVTEMCMWACVPKPYLQKILQETTIHSIPTIQSIIHLKADQLDGRIRNVLALREHSVTLGERLKAMPLSGSAPEKRKAIKDEKIRYTADDDVMQHMSYKMVDDARMIELLAEDNVAPYSSIAGRIPNEVDFERLMGWKGRASKWWRENDGSQRSTAARNVETIKMIRAILARTGTTPECGQGIVGGRRRSRRRQKTQRKRRGRPSARRTRGKRSRRKPGRLHS